MPMRKSGETISQFAIRTLFETGQFWDRVSNPEGANIKQSDLATLSLTDDVVVRALISFAKIDAARYTINSLNKGHSPDFSGDLNPGMQAMVEEGRRCPVPDHAPPPGVVFAFDDPDLQQLVLRMQERQTMAAIGNGSWPGCHGIGNFHCVTQRVNPAGMNPRVVPLWKTIMQNVQKAYAGIGLLWRFIGMDNVDLLTGEQFSGVINSDLTFVSSSAGWIGLAIVGQNEPCTSKIWAKLLSSFTGGTTDIQIIMQVGALLTHEDGHNAGLGHTNGGIMNPSIGSSSPVGIWLPNDPSTPKLKSLYGGVPVPIPGGTPPGPGPGPDPPTNVESRLHALEIQDVVQKVTIDWAVGQIRKITGT